MIYPHLTGCKMRDLVSTSAASSCCLPGQMPLVIIKVITAVVSGNSCRCCAGGQLGLIGVGPSTVS